MTKKAYIAILLGLFLCLSANAEEKYPQFPWLTWGELSYPLSARDNSGLKVDGYIEQSVDWFRLGLRGPIVSNFVGLKFGASQDTSYWWENKLGPWFGLRFKMPFTLSSPEAAGEVWLSLRGEYYTYSTESSPYKDDARCIVGFQWFASGKWQR